MKKEQLEELKKCKSKEEVIAFLKTNNIELNEEELEKVTGGYRLVDGESNICPNAIYGVTKED